MSAGSVAPVDRWTRVRTAFLACHATRLNVALHLVSAPLGLWAAFVLTAQIGRAVPVAIGALMVTGSSVVLPARLAAIHAISIGALVTASLMSAIPIPWLVVALAGAYALQEFAHLVSDEPTYESDYQGRPGAWGRFAEHVVLLLPLVLAAAPRARGALLERLVPRRSLLTTRLVEAQDRNALDRLRHWVEARTPASGQTTHWWVRELDETARAVSCAVSGSEAIASMFRERHGPRARIRPVEAMNEVYVAGPDRETSSDRVFYVPHIDGPFAVYPGATLYRCMVAVSPNRRIRTHFPLERNGGAEAVVTLDETEVVAFDYHRTPHYISALDDGAVPTPRINLKLHYVVSSPRLATWADALSNLSARYNEWARSLFLGTLTPDRAIDRFAARAIVWQTHVWQQIARRVGHRNLIFVAALCLVSLAIGSAWPLVLFGSFIHYFLYMAAFSSRLDVSFGVFKRDALFYKSLSLVILGMLYLIHFEFDPVSLGLMSFGFGLAALATDALGLDRTYFGAELGVCEAQKVERFPYGAIPHPMILGSIVGLIGVGALDPLRRAWPWLVPLHIAFYLAHLLQEIFDLHEGRKASRAEPAETT